MAVARRKTAAKAAITVRICVIEALSPSVFPVHGRSDEWLFRQAPEHCDDGFTK
jgi:hypothetical protein